MTVTQDGSSRQAVSIFQFSTERLNHDFFRVVQAVNDQAITLFTRFDDDDVQAHIGLGVQNVVRFDRRGGSGIREYLRGFHADLWLPRARETPFCSIRRLSCSADQQKRVVSTGDC